MQFVAAEGRDHEQSLVACVPRQEREQVAGRAVGPVEVLDDEQDRIGLAEPAEQPQRALEDPGLEPFGLAGGATSPAHRRRPRGPARASSGRLGSGGLGDPFRVDLAGQRPKGFDDRPEREPILAERDRATLDDQPVAIAQTRRRLLRPGGSCRRRPRHRRGRATDGRRQPNRPSRGASSSSSERPTKIGLLRRRAMPSHDRARSSPLHPQQEGRRRSRVKRAKRRSAARSGSTVSARRLAARRPGGRT